jgi:hypothetical protein
MIIKEEEIMRYIIISIISGILFGIMDGLINANLLAQRLYRFYQPIARTSINMPAGMIMDLVYGFVMAGVFLLLYPSLSGNTGLFKGISFALLIWFFRVVMSAISGWMMFAIPMGTVLYTLITGLAEMLVLGILFGLTLKP